MHSQAGEAGDAEDCIIPYTLFHSFIGEGQDNDVTWMSDLCELCDHRFTISSRVPIHSGSLYLSFPGTVKR